jgi:predicted enzyme related to lactoylglutathione lyase
MTRVGPIQVVSLYVEDQDRALHFYTETLGFELRRDNSMGDGHRWIEVAPQGAETALVLYPRAMKENWREHEPSLVFHADDVRAVCKVLAEAGVEIVMEPQTVPWGVFATIADPDDNRLSIRTPNEGFE